MVGETFPPAPIRSTQAPGPRQPAPRILVISSLFPSGVHPNRGIFVLNRLKAIRCYADLKVINPIPWFPLQSRLSRYRDYHRVPKTETMDGIEVYHPRFFAVPLLLKVLAALTYCMAVLPIALRLRKSWGYDLIELHWTYPDLPAGRLLARLLGLKQLVTIRGEAALQANGRGLRSMLVRRLLPNADYVITLSDRLKDLSILQGVSREKIATIGNGVDTARFHWRDSRACRARLGLPPAGWILLGIGYLSPHKGFDRILEALPQVLQRRPDAELYLIGPDGAFAQGDSTAELKRLAERLGVQDKVHFVGEVGNAELVDWYNAADCFCLSSRSEGCPNVLLEALACGCPVVATDVGSVAEILSEPFLGKLVPDSTEGVRAGLLSALAQPYDRHEIAAHVQKHDWDSCARRVVAIYEQLLGGPEPSPVPATSAALPSGDHGDGP